MEVREHVSSPVGREKNVRRCCNISLCLQSCSQQKWEPLALHQLPGHVHGIFTTKAGVIWATSFLFLNQALHLICSVAKLWRCHPLINKSKEKCTRSHERKKTSKLSIHRVHAHRIYFSRKIRLSKGMYVKVSLVRGIEPLPRDAEVLIRATRPHGIQPPVL